MGLNKETLTADFGGTLRAGTCALRAAFDTVDAGSARHILVVCADTRLGMPNGTNEMDFGDGAVAFLVGAKGPAVTVEGKYSICNEIYDYWRPDGERFVRAWEERFNRESGYTAVVPETIKEACAKFGVKPSDFSKVCLYAPDPRQMAMAAKAAGFDAKGGQVEIRGFCSFFVKEYGSNTGWKPEPGERVKINPKKLLFFRLARN